MGRTRPRLLVLDDERDIAEFIGAIGGKAGLEPVVTTGFDDFRANLGDHVDVITIDLMMPGVDGIEVLRHLAEIGSDAAIILISGIDSRVRSTAEHLALEHGLQLVASIAKPFIPSALADCFHTALTWKRRHPIPITEVDYKELSVALDTDALSVVFQPKVALKTGDVVGVEAMVRWAHPVHGLLEPSSFLDLAERSDQVLRLTDQVFERSLAQSVEWAGSGLALHLALNLSGRCLDQLDLPERLVALASRYHVPTDQILIELTETCVAARPAAALDVAARLRLRRFKLSLDDFGTGCATLSQLKQLPFTELKLDRSFVRAAVTDRDARHIVESSIHLAHALGLTTVAEGIETHTHWRLLTDLGCDLGQGYFISAPMSGSAFLGWLADWNEYRRSAVAQPPTA